jgi:predicted dehydrogenase
MGRVRLGVIGVGHLGKEHARILAALPEVELVGVADVNSDQANRVARQTGCRAFSSHRPLSQLIDAAIVAAPTTSHHAIASELLRSGIALLVEKPLAASLAQAEELVELARRHHVPLQVGHIERFNPALERLQQCDFQPRFVECERIGTFTGRSTDVGAVLDLMIHDIDVLLSLVAAPVLSVDAIGASIFGAHEDVANARLTLGTGCVANLTASRASPVARRCMQVWGAEGYACIDFAERSLTLIQPSEQLRLHGLNPQKLDQISRDRLKDELFERYFEVLDIDCKNQGTDQLTAELKHFVSCLKTGATPRVGGEAGRDALAVAQRILQSIQRHAWNGHIEGPVGPFQLPRPRAPLFQRTAGHKAA